jgi:hypothetical protein
MADLTDRNIDIEEEIADLIEENNNDEITPKKRKENKQKIKRLEKETSDKDTVIAENEIFLDDTEEKFNRITERLMDHNYVGRVDGIPPPPPMLGNNYDVPNGLFGVGRDIFLRLAAEKHHGDESSREIFGMGRKPYMWRNHWLWRLRNVDPEVRGTPNNPNPEDYGEDPPPPYNPFNDPPPPPPPPPAPFV